MIQKFLVRQKFDGNDKSVSRITHKHFSLGHFRTEKMVFMKNFWCAQKSFLFNVKLEKFIKYAQNLFSYFVGEKVEVEVVSAEISKYVSQAWLQETSWQ